MKNYSYANRGESLEDSIRTANERYRQHGLAFIHKNATEFKPIRDNKGKIVNCKVEGKATIDFLGRIKGFPLAVEAKNTNDVSIRWDRVEDNQAEDMEIFCREPGTIGLVVVSFSYKRYFAIPWYFWEKAYDLRVRKNDRKTPLAIQAYGTTWDIPTKASFRIDEIPPEFEVDPFDPKITLHYLKRAFMYITPNMQCKKTEN